MGIKSGEKPVLRWICIPICILALSAAISYLTSTYIIGKKYESTSTLVVFGYGSDEENKTLGSTETYRVIATSNQMMEEIISKLDLEYRIKDMKKKVVVSYDGDTEFIFITAHDKNPEIAFKICQSMVAGLQNRVKELFGENYLKVVDEPYITSEPASPDVVLNIAISVILAILLSGLIIIWDIKRR